MNGTTTPQTSPASSELPPTRMKEPRGPRGDEHFATAGAGLEASAQNFASSAEELLGEADDFLRHHAEERPYVLLGTAAAVGYVLGGGLATRLTGLLVAVGARALAAEWIDSALTRPSRQT